MDYDFGVNILQNDGRIGQLLGKLQKVAISIGIFDIYGTLQKRSVKLATFRECKVLAITLRLSRLALAKVV